jgi:hypothetical protein
VWSLDWLPPPTSDATAAASSDAGRGLHSSTFQLNLSATHGIGGARGGSVARGEMVLGGV